MADVIILDSSKCRLTYLNEGGANFVFRITVLEESKWTRQLHRKLLRLRKQVVNDPDELLAHEEWASVLGSKNVIEHDLIRLPVEAMWTINDVLTTVQRPDHRMNDFWPGGRFGVLVTDMTPGDGERLVELKPKWLTQSPTAPLNATRCRTCALRAQRAAQMAIVTATDAQGSCPLALVSGKAQYMEMAGERLTDDRQVQE